MSIEEKFAAIKAEGFTWQEAMLLTSMEVEVLSKDEALKKWTPLNGAEYVFRG